MNACKQKVKINFQVTIESVHPNEIHVISDHLIKKGASFYLSGPELKKITPHSEKIFVRVTRSNATLISEQKKYQIELEIDGGQAIALGEIRLFLSNSKNGF